METVRLRVSDIDTERLSVRVREGKGGKTRIVTLAPDLIAHIIPHLKSVEILYQQDLALRNHGWDGVYLPLSLIHISEPTRPY